MDSRQAGQRRHFGARQERLASRYLQSFGLVPVTSNYQCRVGEIDLIMRDGGTLVFVEVRYRRRRDFGTAAESVGRAKQRKLWRCAQYYLMSRRLSDHPPCRFDVLGITEEGCSREPVFDWIRNAFALDGF